jgi:hypothetical protein
VEERDDTVEQCALVVDGLILDLRAMLKARATSTQGRDITRQNRVRFAVAWMTRASESIRHKKSIPDEPPPPQNELESARTVLRECRAVVETIPRSAHRARLLAKIDAALNSPSPAS